MTPDFFAHHQYRDYVIYTALARRERNPEFRRILELLIGQEYTDYEFWKQFATQKEFRVRRLDVVFYLLLRRLFGLTFTAKFLEGRERLMIERYERYIAGVKEAALRVRLEAVLAHEREHERYFINQVREGKVEFMSSIVLGLNDGLIELTGALTGFSFALGTTRLVAAAGLITGVAASLSMAASAFLQAEFEAGKRPQSAALYTGVSYLAVVGILVAPFFFFGSVFSALALMLTSAVAIIAAVSFYTAVIFGRSFARQLGTMLFFSLGVAAVAFSIGFLFRTLTGVTV
ncbi:MAG: VIT1/CCC1 transporter family protein [Patescibacteria group bacterium]|nr:VIT1/CCC1 transporter family protein [Patescibacteria group bacterium]